MSETTTAAPLVAIHLLDPSVTRPVKSWRFDQKGVITIGRADDQDIEISDPYVSRNHAEFHFLEEGWMLLSKGRNGVLIDNRAVDRFVLSGDVNFRLGPNGPSLRFEMSAAEASAEGNRTLCFDTLPTDFFGVDRRKVQREVEEITTGDYFRDLQDKAATLRRQRQD